MKKVESSPEQQHVIQAFAELAPHYEKKWTRNYVCSGLELCRTDRDPVECFAGSQRLRVLDLATGKLVIPKAVLSRYPQVKYMLGLDITTVCYNWEKRDGI